MLRLPRTLFGRMTLGVALITGILLATEAWLLSWQIHSSIQDLHALLLEAAADLVLRRLNVVDNEEMKVMKVCSLIRR